MQQNYINHVVMALDASGSMRHLGPTVAKVADAQIAYLAQRSRELDQETRVTIYSFDDKVECLVYDKDVLRLPSIKSLYRIGGNTALMDATMKALEDLDKTAQLYGEHAFLIYVLTDGEENASRNVRPETLARRLGSLPDNWTLAAFVPDARGVHEAKKFGFPKDNIAVWDATSSQGVSEVGERIRATTDAYMTARSAGVKSFRNLFTLDASKLSTQTLKKNLKALTPGQFRLYDVPDRGPIAEFVERKTRRAYRLGEAYYQLVKAEKVQPQKFVAVYDKKGHTVYTGDQARELLGLPDYEVKVGAEHFANYDIFVQSTSTNRILPAGTKLLVLS